MAGLDNKVLDVIEAEKVIERIKIDLRSDFILAPHYNAIFLKAADEVWQKAQELLRSGKYEPELPHTISIPKGRGFVRPGSILAPLDRFVYQALIDVTTPVLEQQLDRKRTFSHVPCGDHGSMFEPTHESWKNFQHAVSHICQQGGYVVKADIANYFERIPQHHLINLLSAAHCKSGAVNLLEEMLLAFQERDSFGIVQGLFPSDILGNFFLSDFDAYCDLHDIPSARYVDDIYLHFPTEIDAKRGLIDLIERLRQNGLHLNEYKSGIHTADNILREETELDTLFDEAREEVRDDLTERECYGYGFSAEWEWEEPEDEEIELASVERLYNAIKDNPEQSDKIEKFCLPYLRVSGSDSAIDSVLTNLVTKPHLTRIYHSYLSHFVSDNEDLVKSLEASLSSKKLVTDFQRMYLLGSLFNAPSIQKGTVNTVLHWLENAQIAKETRAIAAIFAAKHGNLNQKRSVRVRYENEPSEYVRGAILYAARYLTSPEKKTCKKAWGGHTVTNALIAQSM